MCIYIFSGMTFVDPSSTSTHQTLDFCRWTLRFALAASVFLLHSGHSIHLLPKVDKERSGFVGSDDYEIREKFPLRTDDNNCTCKCNSYSSINQSIHDMIICSVKYNQKSAFSASVDRRILQKSDRAS